MKNNEVHRRPSAFVSVLASLLLPLSYFNPKTPLLFNYFNPKIHNSIVFLKIRSKLFQHVLSIIDLAKRALRITEV
jgi:hypothetical protein